MADPGNFVRIATQAAFMGLAAYGLTFLMIAGEIDLSAGAMAGLGAAVAGKLISGLRAARMAGHRWALSLLPSLWDCSTALLL